MSTNIQIARRYLEHAGYVVSYQTVAEYLKLYVNNPPKTYNRQIVVLRHLIRDFLRHPESTLKVIQDKKKSATIYGVEEIQT